MADYEYFYTIDKSETFVIMIIDTPLVASAARLRLPFGSLYLYLGEDDEDECIYRWL